MSFFAGDHENCPYCGFSRPEFVRAKTARWEVIYTSDVTECELPHRLFHPFSFAHNDDTEYEAVIDFSAKTAFPVTGTRAFPDGLTFDFLEASK
jgi:hypothetical protein